MKFSKKAPIGNGMEIRFSTAYLRGAFARQSHHLVLMARGSDGWARTFANAVKAAARMYGIEPQRITSQSRSGAVIDARNAAMYLAEKIVHLERTEIAERFEMAVGDINRGIREIEVRLQRSQNFRDFMKEITGWFAKPTSTHRSRPKPHPTPAPQPHPDPAPAASPPPPPAFELEDEPAPAPPPPPLPPPQPPTATVGAVPVNLTQTAQHFLAQLTALGLEANDIARESGVSTQLQERIRRGEIDVAEAHMKKLRLAWLRNR